jgi:hypothetical protein
MKVIAIAIAVIAFVVAMVIGVDSLMCEPPCV